jgi:trehalose 6-phosphate phosphatase
VTAPAPAPLARPEWAYLFDIDGTLSPIAESPAAAAVDPALRRLVDILHRATDGAVALVSGRSLADIDRMFPGGGIAAAGQHGAEWRDPSGKVHRIVVPAAEIDRIRLALTAVVAVHPGLFLEDKGLSFAVHYRSAPQLGSYVHRVVRAIHEGLGEGFVLQSGKRIVEVLPAAAAKGSAVRTFMKVAPFAGRTPVFVGDDAADEHAFAAVDDLGGISIKVGRGPTVARYRLASVAAVRDWLEAGAMRRSSAGGRSPAHA